MANLTSNPSSYLDHSDLNWDSLNPFLALNHPGLVQSSSMDCQTFMGFNHDNLINNPQSLCQDNYLANTQACTVDVPVISELVDQGLSHGSVYRECCGSSRNKRKAGDVADCCSLNSSSPVSSGENRKKNGQSSLGKGRKMKKNEEEGEKPKEVVHVRAKRGQATDSHSIAERIRRGKINERLRCLQDIVPGCNKTMGMAVMLDEIINYVQSLQNQVEFLSMKLTAASQFHDFDAQPDQQVEATQKTKGSSGDRSQDVESALSGGRCDQADQFATFFQPTWPF